MLVAAPVLQDMTKELVKKGCVVKIYAIAETMAESSKPNSKQR